MMQGGSQSLESGHPLSPQGSLSGGGANLAKFSLLGQQLTHYGSAQEHHNQSSHASSLVFSLGAHQQVQSHPQQNHQPAHSHAQQQHLQSHVQPQTHSRGGDPSGEGAAGVFQNSQRFANIGQSFNLQQFVGQMANQGLPDNGANQTIGSGQYLQTLINGLAVLQQKIGQLQALVPLIGQTGQGLANSNVVLAQQQAAGAAVVSIISQLAVAGMGILAQQPLMQMNPSPNLQLGQLVGSSVNQGLNLFEQNGIESPLGTAIWNVLGNSPGNIFAAPGGVGGGAPAGGGGVGSSIRNSSLGMANGSGASDSAFGVNTELSVQQHLGVQQAGGGGSPAMLGNSLGAILGNPLGNAFGVGGSGGASGLTSAVANSPGDGGASSALASGGINAVFDDPDNGSRDEDDEAEGENLPPGSYDLVEMDSKEILAEHTHFCQICGKGFKRDANLRMHMRGHGDEYKTPAALARPDRSSQTPSVLRPRRFSCPFVGCKRNKKHRKFQPLKTILCVKNHYRRSHCPKILTCTKCNAKKFSVIADLKTHEKHCGRDKWQCSCGTTFSRKDKLLGHISLFVGHAPALSLHEMEGDSTGMELGMSTPAGAFVSGDSSGPGMGTGTGADSAGFLSGSENGVNFGSSRDSELGAHDGLEVPHSAGTGSIDIGGEAGGLQGLGSRSGNGGLNLFDEGSGDIHW